MARMIPSFIEEETSNGEKQVFAALQKLSDDYVVFHSVRWNQRNGKNMMEYGESDFTIFHPDFGILVIEVKGGGIEYKNGRWYYLVPGLGDQPMKNPLQQADKSKYRFMDLLEDLFLDDEDQFCRIESAVWFPDVNKRELKGKLPIEYHDELILDRYSLSHPAESIKRVFDFYNLSRGTKLASNSAEKIIEIFAPHYRILPSIGSTRQKQEGKFIRLTQEQQYLLDYLEEQGNAAIQGAAGTGKTMLALEKARRLSKDGKVLFLCFNKFLRLHLQEIKNQNPTAYKDVDFYNLPQLVCLQTNKKDVNPGEIEEFLENFENYNWSYKHIIIDEGQDFTERQIVLLQEISVLTEGSFYIFYDRKQFVQGLSFPDWLNKAECRLILHTNCRNTLKIAKTSGKPVKLETLAKARGVPGELPKFFICTDQKNLQKKIAACIDQYVQNGFSYDQICILTLKTEDTSLLGNVERIGKFPLSSTRKPGKILFTTARKFKGLESDVILLVDLEQAKMTEEENCRLFYVGGSRAKHYLDIFYVGDESSLLEFVNPLQEKKSSYPNGLVGIARELSVRPIRPK